MYENLKQRLDGITESVADADRSAKAFISEKSTGTFLQASKDVAGTALRIAGLKVASTTGSIAQSAYRTGSIAVKTVVAAPELVNGALGRISNAVDELQNEGTADGAQLTYGAIDATGEKLKGAKDYVVGLIEKRRANSLPAGDYRQTAGDQLPESARA